MHIHDRRAVLETAPNPDSDLDYVITLSGIIQTDIPPIPHTNVSVNLRYVPDREITMPVPWRVYLDVLGDQSWGTLEELAVTALADINDQLIPRWMELSVTSLTGESKHSILLSENQPEWNNPSIPSSALRSQEK